MGDLLVIHDTGAHGFSMGYNYNGKLRSAELLLKEDGSVELIRRAETRRITSAPWCGERLPGKRGPFRGFGRGPIADGAARERRVSVLPPAKPYARQS